MTKLEDGKQDAVPQDFKPEKVEKILVTLAGSTNSLSTTRVSSGVNRRHQQARV